METMFVTPTGAGECYFSAPYGAGQYWHVNWTAQEAKDKVPKEVPAVPGFLHKVSPEGYLKIVPAPESKPRKYERKKDEQ
jgi:hypothetical protein